MPCEGATIFRNLVGKREVLRASGGRRGRSIPGTLAETVQENSDKMSHCSRPIEGDVHMSCLVLEWRCGDDGRGNPGKGNAGYEAGTRFTGLM